MDDFFNMQALLYSPWFYTLLNKIISAYAIFNHCFWMEYNFLLSFAKLFYYKVPYQDSILSINCRNNVLL